MSAASELSTASSLTPKAMTTPATIDKEIIKNIKSGKFSDRYLIYCRKSDDEADSQKNSIDYQTRETSRLVASRHFPLAELSLSNFCENGVIAERHSGWKNDSQVQFSKGGKVQYQIDRPKFFQLLQFLNEGRFKGVICLCWDRISRNKGDNTIIRKLMKQGVDFRFAYASYDKSSSGELHMDIDEMFAEHHSRVTREKVAASIANAKQNGLCTGRAPIGYLNPGKMDDKPIDPERGPFITEFFKLYDSGEWSQTALARYANEQGMTTVPMRRKRTREELLAQDEVKLPKIARPITKAHVSRILTNPFYTGRVTNDEGVWVRSKSHRALIDDGTFDRVQGRLSEHRLNLHHVNTIDYPMRGLIRCAHCERVYTPYRKKGILYFQAKCAPGCRNTKQNYSFEQVSAAVKDQLAQLHFSSEELAEFEARCGTEIALLEVKRSQEIERNERSRKRIREELAYLRAERVALLRSGAFTPDDYAKEINKLQCSYDSSLETEEVSEEAMRAVMQDVATLSELIKLSVPLYENVDPRLKEKIARTVFSELFVSHDTLRHKLKPGFEAFLRPKVSDGAPSTTLSELCVLRREIRANVSALNMLIRFLQI